MHQENEMLPPREMMAFPTAIKTCFNKYADFKGRATRAEFWWFELFVTLVGAATSKVDTVLFGVDFSDSGALESLWSLAIILPSLAVGARRLHDINRSGWWQLIVLTVIGIIPLIIMWCLRSNPEENRFGNPV